jgi:hypothetical protein
MKSIIVVALAPYSLRAAAAAHASLMRQSPRKSIITLAAATILSAIAAQARATPVTWTFYETGCTSLSGGPCNALPPVALPYPLAALMLPGPTSSGTAFWPGGDPRHIETCLRLAYGTLDHLSRDEFRSVCPIARRCVEADPDAAERLAQSYGL